MPQIEILDGLDVGKLVDRAYNNALGKGFWDGEAANFHTKIALIHSEISEALQAHRKDKGLAAVVEELADVVIRVFDLAGGYGVDLAWGMREVLYWELFDKPPPRMGFPYRILQLHDTVSSVYPINDGRFLAKPLGRICIAAHRLAEYEGAEYFGGAIIRKMKKNESREHLHGARY